VLLSTSSAISSEVSVVTEGDSFYTLLVYQDPKESVSGKKEKQYKDSDLVV